MLNRCRALKSYPGFESLPHRQFFLDNSAVSLHQSLRLHIVSTAGGESGGVEEVNGGFQRCRTQVHISLRHRQVFVSCQLLNGSCWSAPHGEMRAKRMTQQMHAMPI